MPEGVEQDARDEWFDRLQNGALRPGPQLTAETLADRFGRVDEDTADELCNQAAMAATADGATEVRVEHFESAAADVLDEDGGGDGAGDDHADGSPEPEAYDPDTDAVPDASSFDPDELEQRVVALETRVGELESRVATMHELTNQNVPLMRAALNALLNCSDVEELPGAAGALREGLDVDGGGDS